jgi:hypothetical protein
VLISLWFLDSAYFKLSVRLSRRDDAVPLLSFVIKLHTAGDEQLYNVLNTIRAFWHNPVCGYPQVSACHGEGQLKVIMLRLTHFS